ncbi:GntR family transcriptional regulator [Phaeobacter porticola]|uniref:Ligand-binding UTRA domain-containing protein n=1 Tax=Phaeobacter porticola TaxID=1844006 RepID=A0A1L3I5V3_9RHOB|nr:GntR family transcriptional regulator [Phaeobacter porticola]APG47480.1 ligand-binding UTRA domain-containing protein [Phaeobacter porticola]
MIADQMTHNAPSSTATETHFARIADALRQQIQTGTLPSGAALPSERVVAETYEVSRMTARRALEALEAEGLAYSEGRRGRFVSPARVAYDVSHMVSFVADAQTSDRDLTIEIIDTATGPACAVVSDALNLPLGSEVYSYTRLFRIDGHATFVETEYVSAARFPGLLDHDLQHSTTALLQQHYDAQVSTGEITIRMRPMTCTEAQHLGQSPNRAGLELQQVILDQSGLPFCLGRQIWRGELAEFSARAIVDRVSSP